MRKLVVVLKTDWMADELIPKHSTPTMGSSARTQHVNV